MASTSKGATESKDSKEWKLNKENELRIEAKGSITLKVTHGNCEIFGSELVPGKTYTFSNWKFAAFTWSGCQITISGKWEVAYVSEETPMISYINTHAALQRMRQDAKSRGAKGKGPVVMITGPKDSGKSTLARILLSYAVRCSWKPTLVDLDVGQNEITSPGCIAACPIDQPIGIDSDWKNKAPVVYFYGHTTPTYNQEIYKKLCGKLAETVANRCATNITARHSGVVLNTCGWTDGGGVDVICQLAEKFKVEVILVLGQERLASDLKSSEILKKLGSTVVKLDKSGGVVSRLPKLRTSLRVEKIRNYFYGRNNHLSPHEKVVPFGEVLVYRVGGTVRAPTSALPIGAKPMLDPNRCVKVGITKDLLHCILAVSYATKADELLEANIAGLLFVKEIDEKRQRMTVLAPSAGNLPHKLLLFGSLKWFDG
ncbi:hypothetical protein AAMO2058_001518900 [Amorphochlora amoebiformis]